MYELAPQSMLEPDVLMAEVKAYFLSHLWSMDWRLQCVIKCAGTRWFRMVWPHADYPTSSPYVQKREKLVSYLGDVNTSFIVSVTLLRGKNWYRCSKQNRRSTSSALRGLADTGMLNVSVKAC
jgi:hypothetical protein